MFLIVGLGNPGSQYESTRHNVGFLFLDALAQEAGVSINQSKFHALYARGSLDGYDVVFLKPTTFMNVSGTSVQEAMHFFKVAAEKVIVVFDDLDLEAGTVKMRVGGGHGGHNGIRDILAKTTSDKFYRIKIGIGKPQHKSATTGHVLGKFSSDELRNLQETSFPMARERLVSILKSAK